MEKIMGPLGAFLNRFQMDRRHSRRWKPVSFLPFSFLYLAAPPRIRKVAFDRSCQLVPEEEPSSSSSSSTCSSSSLSKKRGEMLTRRFVTFLIFFFSLFDVLYFSIISNDLVKLSTSSQKLFSIRIFNKNLDYFIYFYLFSFLFDYIFLKGKLTFGEQKSHCRILIRVLYKIV